MYNYVNKVSIAANGNKTEIVLSFSQESPVFEVVIDPENGEQKTLQTLNSEIVSNLVMTSPFAQELAHLILSIVDGKEE